MTDLTTRKALTFDLFGTVLDLGGSLTPFIADFIRGRDALDRVNPDAFWAELRHRQRIEQYQDSLLELGHTGYLETAQKAFVYVARLNELAPTPDEVEAFMAGWQQLYPFQLLRRYGRSNLWPPWHIRQPLQFALRRHRRPIRTGLDCSRLLGNGRPPLSGLKIICPYA